MDKYRTRLAILDAVESLEPGVCTLDEIALHTRIDGQIRCGALDKAGLYKEVMALVERGYLSDGRPGREPLIGLTPKGRGQVHREEDLDEYIWGTMASKFQQ